MLLHSFIMDNYVVYVHTRQSKLVRTNSMNCCRSVGKPKGSEGCFLFVLVVHLHLPLSRYKINHRKYRSTREWIQKILDTWQGVCVFVGAAIQMSVVNAVLIIPTFVFSSTAGDDHRLLLFSIKCLTSIPCVCRSTSSLRCISICHG